MCAGAWLGLALYAIFLLAAPLAHHDFACHQTTPAHCPACVAADSGLDSPLRVSFVAERLPALGTLAVCIPAAGGTWLPSAAAGRAPPVPAS